MPWAGVGGVTGEAGFGGKGAGDTGADDEAVGGVVRGIGCCKGMFGAGVGACIGRAIVPIGGSDGSTGGVVTGRGVEADGDGVTEPKFVSFSLRGGGVDGGVGRGGNVGA
ncbi:MAG: hypothetical protein A3A33_00125 [Candidatus Yanofskybacteria bacterium RIFCSPLOWO2_01_FULL_49_25]|uniref:Uncharacterized protein n=1 Tax=Candidatus Yanofskybacteria bacterium RIFCSPLOWO2_01_FULL_49_25 TaxID=1802701 RepID=A0A1F8GUU1_9BACT|nr:MAG: hypothetical protein A3A33_00125 [Candidatus Yanofskybacteria bacterium RIFCSPLOWO2_01_FULL_49_25]